MLGIECPGMPPQECGIPDAAFPLRNVIGGADFRNPGMSFLPGIKTFLAGLRKECLGGGGRRLPQQLLLPAVRRSSHSSADGSHPDKWNRHVIPTS